MEQQTVAKQLEALGSPTRLEIYQQLVMAGNQGLNVGVIGARLGVPSSTLSYHLAKLVHGGLISQERNGRRLLCRVDSMAMDSLVMYLANNCCSDDSNIWG